MLKQPYKKGYWSTCPFVTIRMNNCSCFLLKDYTNKKYISNDNNTDMDEGSAYHTAH